MKRLIWVWGIFSIGALEASSSVDRQLENCGSNLTCVAKVLAELIENNGTSSGNTTGEIVEFYHDDGRCELDNLMKRVRFGITSEGCQRAAQGVTKNVWGVRVNGVCSDISDTDFLSACTKYAAIDKSRSSALSEK